MKRWQVLGIRLELAVVGIGILLVGSFGCDPTPVADPPHTPPAPTPADPPVTDIPVLEPEIQYVDSDPQAGTSAAVVVAGYALAHTAQILPLDPQGDLVGEDSLDQQLDQVMTNLEAVLASVDSGMEQLVKLDVFVDSPETVVQVRQQLPEYLGERVQPAVNWTATPLPVPGAQVSLDAVATVPDAGPDQTTRHRVEDIAGPPDMAQVGVLPRGGAVYLSGHPERGEMAPATAKSLAFLINMLNEMGLDRDDVVHVRVFLDAMDQADVVRREIAAAFEGQTIPPVTMAHWISPAPMEIEMIASAAPGGTGAETVRFFTPAGIDPSPRFSRAALVDGGRRIYISSLYSPEPGTGEEQVAAIFETMQNLLEQVGSDLRHLVKATYYCADDDSSRALDLIRDDLFDPERPPAASKVMVNEVAIPDRSIVIDMIAVTPP